MNERKEPGLQYKTCVISIEVTHTHNTNLAKEVSAPCENSDTRNGRFALVGRRKTRVLNRDTVAFIKDDHKCTYREHMNLESRKHS